MTSVSSSAAIGLTVAIGPVIAAHLLPQIWMFDQFGAVILGLIIGIQAACPRGTQHDRCGAEEVGAPQQGRQLLTRLRLGRGAGQISQQAGKLLARQVDNAIWPGQLEASEQRKTKPW